MNPHLHLAYRAVARNRAQYLVLLCAVLALCCPRVAQAQSLEWRRLSGPNGGTVWTFVDGPDGSVLASTSPDGILRSTDDGRTWSAFGPRGEMRAMLYAHGTLFARDIRSGVMSRASDADTTWTALTLTGTPLSAEPMIVARDGSLLFVGDSGIERSVDVGRTWSRVGPGGKAFRHAALAADGTVFVIGARGGVDRSTDHGVTWETMRADEGSTLRSLALLPSGELLVAIDGSVYVSDDGGASFRPLATLPRPGLNNAIGVIDETLIVFLTEDGAYLISLDGQKSDLRQVAPWHSLRAVHVTKDGAILLGYHGRGVYRSSDDGVSFSSIGLPVGWQVRTLSQGPDGTLFASAVDSSQGMVTTSLFRSTDRGATWIDAGLYEGRPVRVVAANDSTLIGLEDRFRCSSTNAGRTWRVTRYNRTRDDIVSTNDGTVLGFGRDGLSTYTVSTGWVERLFYTIIDHVAIAPSGEIRAIGDAFYLSTDKGTTWRTEELSAPLRQGDRLRQIMMPADDTILLLEQAAPSRLLRSTDGGRTWDTTGFRCASGLSTMASYGERGLYLSSDCGVLLSTDAGANWRLIADRPAGEHVGMILLHSGGELFHAGSTGIHIAAPPSAVESSLRSGDPESGITILGGNAESVTVLMLTSGTVEITATSITGELLYVASAGHLVPGVHRIALASPLHSGLYLITATSEVGATTKLVRVIR